MSQMLSSDLNCSAPLMAEPRIVILGCGNPSRGDDALGPVLLELAELWIRRHPDKRVAVVEDFQFQVEHILDLEDRDLAIFVDASASGPDPCMLRRIEPQRDASFSTHAITPQAVLHAFRSLGQGEPPPAFALAIRGHSFELGDDLSSEAQDNLEAAWSLLGQMLEAPALRSWENMCAVPPWALIPR